MSNTYAVTNSWGGTSGHSAGDWTLGNRQPNQYIESLNISSSDGGKTYTGTMQYSGEGPIGVSATQTNGNTYAVTNSWGGTSGHSAGNWTIGSRAPNQYALNLEITGNSAGQLTGTMQYDGEGPIGFNGTLL